MCVSIRYRVWVQCVFLYVWNNASVILCDSVCIYECVGGCVRVRLCSIESSRLLLMPEIPERRSCWRSRWPLQWLGKLAGPCNWKAERRFQFHPRIEAWAWTWSFACSTVRISVVSDSLTTLASCWLKRHLVSLINLGRWWCSHLTDTENAMAEPRSVQDSTVVVVVRKKTTRNFSPCHAMHRQIRFPHRPSVGLSSSWFRLLGGSPRTCALCVMLCNSTGSTVGATDSSWERVSGTQANDAVQSPTFVHDVAWCGTCLAESTEQASLKTKIT